MRTFGKLAFWIIRIAAGLASKVLRRSPRMQAVLRNVVLSSDEIRAGVRLLGSASSAQEKSPTTNVTSDYVRMVANKRLPRVTLVIPVYNAFEAVHDCLAAIASSELDGVDVVIVDDASTDTTVSKFLAEECNRNGWTLLRNEVNLGYTPSINRGINLHPANDVVLLNSDTSPNGRWIAKLQYAAYRHASVGTVTPISDNSGAFSVPRHGVYNSPPLGWDLETFTRAVQQAGTAEFLDVPTGNGFCMFIRRAAIEDCGVFNEELFPRGYGEENEFCMRLRDNGWASIVTDKVFVSHRGSQSFGEEKGELIEKGLQKVRLKFPEYDHLVQRFFDNQFAAMRNRVFTRIAESALPKKRLLFIQPISGGGLPATNNDLAKGVSQHFEVFRLGVNDHGIWVFDRWENLSWVSTSIHFSESVHLLNLRDPKFDSFLADVVFAESIDVIHVEHLQFASLSSIGAIRRLVDKLTLTIHDFYTICPTTQLLDENGVFCGGKCTATMGQCPTALDIAYDLPRLKNKFVHRWQASMNQLLFNFDQFFAPSKAAASRFLSIYPATKDRVSVIEHGRDDLPGEPVSGNVNQVGSKILLLGAIGKHKGSEVIEAVLPELATLGVEVELLGSMDRRIHPQFLRDMGSYSRSELDLRVRRSEYAFVFIASIWEETYAHTVSEAFSLGLPVVCFNLGAQAERVAESGAGFIIDLALAERPKELAKSLAQLVSDTNSLSIARNHSQVAADLLRARGTSEMAADYLTAWSKDDSKICKNT